MAGFKKANIEFPKRVDDKEVEKIERVLLRSLYFVYPRPLDLDSLRNENKFEFTIYKHVITKLSSKKVIEDSKFANTTHKLTDKGVLYTKEKGYVSDEDKLGNINRDSGG